ncbi:hypothetical protein ACTVZO_38015 [Streptomyces sp. IBSNAI002]|uniref:hypothetical protein n=1 Tax=Streptomyces sp. IBSNAI002 TaxID=3457500 RepID=UPI003FCEEB8F
MLHGHDRRRIDRRAALPAVDAYDITRTPPRENIELCITSTTKRIGGKELQRFSCTDLADSASGRLGAGLPVVVDSGDTVRLNVHNQTSTPGRTFSR